MSVRQIVVTALALVHLTFVACRATNFFPQRAHTVPGHALDWYGAMSGANMDYGFFAPRVGEEVRVRFVVTDASGHTLTDDLEAGHNKEVKLRLAGAFALLTEPGEPAFQEDLLACWAAALFGRHPQARLVGAYVEMYRVPSMAEYRAGARPSWEPLGAAAFRRDSSARDGGKRPP